MADAVNGLSAFGLLFIPLSYFLLYFPSNPLFNLVLFGIYWIKYYRILQDQRFLISIQGIGLKTQFFRCWLGLSRSSRSLGSRIIAINFVRYLWLTRQWQFTYFIIKISSVCEKHSLYSFYQADYYK